MSPQFLLLFVTTFFGPRVDDPQKDIDALQGNWSLVSLHVNGGDLPEDQFQNAKLVIKEQTYKAEVGEMRVDATFKIDATKSPKTIDFTAQSGQNKGKTVKGIYVIDGDTFKFCRGIAPEIDRPKEFTAEADSERVLVVWKRAKP